MTEADVEPSVRSSVLLDEVRTTFPTFFRDPRFLDTHAQALMEYAAGLPLLDDESGLASS